MEIRHGRWVPNPEHYIDYQDCKHRGVDLMLCGGLTGFRTPLGSLDIGGLELMDLRDNRPVHQIPVTTYLDEGTPPTRGWPPPTTRSGPNPRPRGASASTS